MAGKWWGNRNVRPIIALHGWQDNAGKKRITFSFQFFFSPHSVHFVTSTFFFLCTSGTFDTLIPLLPSHVGYLAVDLPGHGLSSHLPNGVSYNTFDFLYVISSIARKYKWEKISLMAHSMSAQLGYYYAGSFPDKIDMLISLDVLKPHSKASEKMVNDISRRIEAMLLHDARTESDSKPPCYAYEDLINRLHEGTFKSVTKEAAPYLLNRNIAPSTSEPSKFYFTRDNRLKGLNYAIPTHDVNLELAKRIVCPHLFIKATNSPLYEKEHFYEDVLNRLKAKPTFKFVSVEGMHHVHLTDPTKISSEVSAFINKHRPM